MEAMPPRRRIPTAEGMQALQVWRADPSSAPPAIVATAVRFTLEELAAVPPALSPQPPVAPLRATPFINSLAHTIGNRRFTTRDDSRNSLLLALITLGEGWHNNHHRFMGSTRQGFYWWEIDVTYYVLRALSGVWLIWDLKTVPHHIYEEAAKYATPLAKADCRPLETVASL